MSHTSSTASKHIIEEANLTLHTIAEDVLEILEDDYRYLPGDKLAVNENLENGPQLKTIEVEVLPVPGWEVRADHPEWKDVESDFDMKVLLTLHVEEMNSDLIKQVISSWLIDEDKDCPFKYLNHEVKHSTATYHVVEVTALVESYLLYDSVSDVKESPRFDNMWNKYMNALITEGVCYIHGKPDVSLTESLRKNITYLAENSVVDYHPNSNDIVRDLVHPALYPYIEGVSKLEPDANMKTKSVESKTYDCWGRKYEDSKFQWLPTPFSISADGKCTISEYVNNLSREKFSLLYSDLEKLFDVFLPYFEEVWSYIKTTKFYVGNEDDDVDFDEDFGIDDAPTEKVEVSLKDRELQVIVKIVEYTLQPEQSYEGVWHAEGMSHENIVMTGLYFLDRDADISGGDLRFKRAFTLSERNHVFQNVPQSRPQVINDFCSEGFVPLGYFPTEEGYMLVFPNCHIHKISKMINSSKNKNSTRRVAVFFVINPDQTIISTRDVAPQQNIVTMEQAKTYRLELMQERKYNKNKLNVRDIELCEH